MRVSRALVLGLVLFGVSVAWGEELAREDREMLEQLLRSSLYDPPPEAERVVVRVPARTTHMDAGEVDREAWRLPDGRVFWADGFDATAAIGTIAPVTTDLAASARARLAPRSSERDARWDEMGRIAGWSAPTDHDLALAAWLHKRGMDSLAAGLLAAVRTRYPGVAPVASLAQALRRDLAWSNFSGMVHAFMVHADAEALAKGEYLLAKFPDEAREWPQAPAIVADLRRRKAKGTFGKPAPTRVPDAIAKTPEQIAALIDGLDEVDARQHMQPGGVDLASDWRVSALIDLGDLAVPQLIDAIEKDERLTRSVHYWRDFRPSRTVLSVREAALVAVMSILRWSVFKPRGTGDNFTGSEADRTQAVARELRTYWEKNKNLRIEQRMLATLTSPESTQEQCREAAQNLAELTSRREIGTTVWTTGSAEPRPGVVNPALALEKPTAAEAILAAMDRDVAVGDPHWKSDEGMWIFTLRKIERHYIDCLIGLGDKRIASELGARAGKATTMRMRRQWALAAHACRDPEPLRAFFADFAAGKLELPALELPEHATWEGPGVFELRQCVETVLRAKTLEGDAALWAATDPRHRYHDALGSLVERSQPWDSDATPVISHPYFLSFLVADLERTGPTDSTFRVDGNQVVEERAGREWHREDAAKVGGELEASVKERRCDRAAARLSRDVIGLPRYHALFKDRDARLEEIKKACRMVRDARHATRAEIEAARPDERWWPYFVMARGR